MKLTYYVTGLVLVYHAYGLLFKDGKFSMEMFVIALPFILDGAYRFLKKEKP